MHKKLEKYTNGTKIGLHSQELLKHKDEEVVQFAGAIECSKIKF